jgi:hypothetical protein
MLVTAATREEQQRRQEDHVGQQTQYQYTSGQQAEVARERKA